MNARRMLLTGLLLGCGGLRDPPPAGTDPPLAAGQRLYFGGELDSARALWERGRAAAVVRGDSVAVARFTTWLGILAWKVGDYATARSLGEAALGFQQRQELTADVPRSYNLLGLVAWNEGRLADAESLHTRTLEAALRAGNDTIAAGARANLGLVHTEYGDFARAREHFEAARDAGHALGVPRIEANALTNLGSNDIRTGDPAAAIAQLLRARQLYQATGNVSSEQNALGQLGDAYAAVGEYRLAIAALDSVLALTRRMGLRQEEASNLEALARLHRDAGDLRGALRLYAEARAIDVELGLEVEGAANTRAEAEIHAALGDTVLARRLAGNALAVHRRLGARFEEFSDLLLLGELGDAGHFVDARRLAAASGVRTARVSVALSEAREADRRRDSPAVLAALGRAADDLAAGGYDSEWQAAALRGRALMRLRRLPEAAVALRAAVAAVERGRGGYGSGALRTGYLAERATAYADLVTALVEQGRVEEAFETSDAARGRALLDHLVSGGSGAGEPDPNDPFAALAARRRAMTGLAANIRDLEAGGAPDSAGRVLLAHWYARLRTARAEYEDAYVRAVERRGSLLQGGSVAAATVRAALGRDEVVLEYLVGSERSWSFAVTGASVRAFPLAIDVAALEGRVRLTRDLLGRPTGSAAATPALAALYDELVRPAERSGALAGARTLVIVPHGALAYLPFAALRDDAGRYLIERYAVQMLPTAAALPALRQRAAMARAGGVAVFAPWPDRLPATRTEAVAVRRASTGARAWQGRGATEARVRRALGDARVVHVATHGVLNAASPTFSRIELATPRRPKPGDDGRLEVHEVLSQHIASDLVFLSGCETGIGPAWSTAFARGEDYATLAQAFLYAGARHVVATLWRVEDEGAAVLAEQFYRHLRDVPPVEALARAQRDLLSRDRYSTPYYWAAYAVSGAGDPGAGAQSGTTASVR